MKLYCNQTTIVATHRDDQAVPASAYGAGIDVLTVADDYPLAHVGAVRPPADAVLVPAMDFLAFLALFTPAEQAAIVGSPDIQVRLFLLMASGSYYGVSLADPRVIGALGYLVTLGLLSAARRDAVLANQAP